MIEGSGRFAYTLHGTNNSGGQASKCADNSEWLLLIGYGVGVHFLLFEAWQTNRVE